MKDVRWKMFIAEEKSRNRTASSAIAQVTGEECRNFASS